MNAPAPTTALQQQARALGDPTRHRIFRYLADADSTVGIAELTAHLGLNHNAIRQHLAKLVDAALVIEETAPAAGRGRPRLVYRVAPGADSRWGVVGPYERLSHLLAEVIRSGDSPREVGRRAARRHAVTSAFPDEAVADVAVAMAREGFEPYVHRRGDRVDIVLRACPFESTAVADPDTVCAVHLGIAEGLAAASDDLVVDDLVAKDPRRANCRLRLHIRPRT